MRALVYRGPGDVVLEEVPDPTLETSVDAIVQITACGICGSDLHIYHGAAGREQGFTVGHEAIGRVVEVGDAVRRWRAGDRVLIAPAVLCDQSCSGCRSGGTCVNPMRLYGVGAGLPGVQAEAVSVPRADVNLVRIPESVSDDNALLLADCAITGWYGVRKARIRPGSTVVVIGLGPVGLTTVMAAFLRGAASVIGIDPLPDRRARAEALGASSVSPEAAKEEVVARTRSGADAVIEAVGADATIALALDLVRPRGSVSVIGVSTSRTMPFPVGRVQSKSIDLHVGLATHHDLDDVIDLVASGRLDPSVVISHRMDLASGRAAYELFDRREAGVCKVVLYPETVS